MSAVARQSPLRALTRAASQANMLIPQAYETGWTDLLQVFNRDLSPGTIAALTGEALPPGAVPAAASSAIAVTNFPSGPMTPGDRDWVNPQSAAMIPIGPNSSGVILGENPKRTLLIIQNNSASGGATFWVSFGTPAIKTNSIGLAPGQSLTLDAAVPRDSVNLLVTGASGVTGGIIVEASYIAQPSLSYQPVNAGAEAWGYVAAPMPPAPPAAAPLATLWSAPPAPAATGYFAPSQVTSPPARSNPYGLILAGLDLGF